MAFRRGRWYWTGRSDIMPYANSEDRRRNYQKNKEHILAKVKAYYAKKKKRINQRRRTTYNYKEIYWRTRAESLVRKKKYDCSEKARLHRRAYEKRRLKTNRLFIIKKRARDEARVIAMKECEKCGSVERLHRHHPDYSKPLVVQILCYDCHLKEHGCMR